MATALLREGPASAASLNPCVSVWLPVVTPLLNTIHRQHWAMRRKATIRLAGLLRLQTHGRRLGVPWEYARVDVVRYSIGVPDHDNLVGGVKALIDCLQPPGPPFQTGPAGGPFKWTCKHPYGLGFIRHDGPDCIRLTVTAVKVATRAEQGTRLTITSLPASPLTPELPSCLPARTTS